MKPKYGRSVDWNNNHPPEAVLGERENGIKPFDRLVDDVMIQAPYNEARRVFLIVDNGSSHRGKACAARLGAKYPRLVVVNGPVHASWLNQVEIYFSVLQRKALTPNDFPSLEAVERRLIGFQHHYERIAKPFDWKFTRDDLTIFAEKTKKCSLRHDKKATQRNNESTRLSA